MRLKLYRAPSVPEAMAKVRAELGADALILGSRPVFDGVELTAALEPDGTTEPPERGHGDILTFHGVPDRLRGQLSYGVLADSLNRVLRFGTLPLDNGPLLMTGPPGAGKTLTVARIATRLVLAGQTPMVIATDDAKAGATEQLRAFARLLGLPLLEAPDPLALSRLLTKRRPGTPILIDALGTDPFDRIQADQLRAMTAAAGACVVLVLPAGLDPQEAAELAQAYAEAGAVCLVATRLDITRRLGGILAAADAARLPLAEAGIGPGAADGLVPLTPGFLAARMLQTGTQRYAT